MKKISITVAALAVAALAVAGCSAPASTGGTTTSAPRSKKVVEDDDHASLPDFTDMSHQDAQDTAQSIGFYNLHEQDASGMDRFLILDRNWKVCSQDPQPGVYSTDVVVTLSSVKIGESCP